MKVRKLNRLRNWDYSKPGWYFVTVCSREREEIFGQIEDNRMVLSGLGYLVKDCLIGLTDRLGIELDEYVVMPNHVHMLIWVKFVSVGNAYMRSVLNVNKSLDIKLRFDVNKVKISREFGMQIWQRNYF